MLSTTMRIEKLCHILEAVEKIAKNPIVRKRVPLAYSCLCYLVKEAHLFTPTDDATGNVNDHGPIYWRRYFTWSYWRDKRPLGLLPFDAADTTRPGQWFKLDVPRQCSAYSRDDHVICVNLDTKETEQFMASCLLHELFHVLRAIEDGRVKQTAYRSLEDRLTEEVRCYDFEKSLFCALGGKMYVQSLDRAALLLQQAQASSMLPDLDFDDALLAMENWLGQPPSPSAAERRANFVFQAQLHRVEQYLAPEQAHRQKLRLVQILYRHYQKEELAISAKRDCP